MERKINWIRAFLIIGLAFSFIGVHFAFTFYSFFDDNFESLVSLLVKKGIIESIIGVLLFVVIIRKTTRKDIKKALQGLKLHIVAAAFLLVMGIAIGILLQNILHGFFQTVFDELTLEAGKIQSIPAHYQSLFIFGNNCRVAALSGILTFVPLFGIFLPFLIMMMNGIIIGIAPAFFDMSWSTFILVILPHGIFELPALVLASAVGLKFGISSLKASLAYFFPPVGTAGRDAFYKEIRSGWQSLKLFAVIIPLLVIAALIEVLISPRIMALYGL